MKAGYKTSEFWVTLVTQVISILSLVGIFNVSSSIGDALIKLTALVASGFTVGTYHVSRAKVKAVKVAVTPARALPPPAASA
jgi:hypothetical protein